MTKELKTLKDFEGIDRDEFIGVGDDYDRISKKELKAEAVNDIKKFIEDLMLAEEINNKEWIIQLKAKIEYIKWKNNLTEDDLLTSSNQKGKVEKE